MIHECVHDAAEGPHVDLLINDTILEHVELFRCSVDRRGNLLKLFSDDLPLLVRQTLVVLDECRATEVANLPIAIMAKHNILNF